MANVSVTMMKVNFVYELHENCRGGHLKKQRKKQKKKNKLNKTQLEIHNKNFKCMHLKCWKKNELLNKLQVESVTHKV